MILQRPQKLSIDFYLLWNSFLTATSIPRSFNSCVSSCPSRRSISDVLFHTDLVSDKRLGFFLVDIA